ncbi:protein pelota [Angomonas deanei]|nr:protein pelota [Angomonas deanei]|eukprot:EPY25818.1 protein pelota [Angomonas deanei]
MDMGVANVILVTPSLMISKAKVEVTISKKHKNDGSARDKSIVKFFKQTLDAVFAHIDIEKLKLILLCSPGHVRDEFFAYMKEQSMRSDDMRSRLLQKNLSKFVLVKVNSCTHDGLREAFLDPTVAIKMSSTKCVDDIRVWERFQVTMNKDPDLCVYTPQCVLQAALSGAMCCLMISDVVFRSEKPVERRFYLSLVNFAKKTGGCTVNIFSSSHVTGEQLSQLGNIAAILLFACPDADDIEIDPIS